MHPNRFTKILFPAVTTAVLVLSGCSSGPSDADIKAVVEKAMASNPIMKDMVTVETKKVGCAKEDKSSAYVCDVQVKSTTKVFGQEIKNEAVQKMRLIKTDDGWMAASL